ncbi:hypothetical protein C8R44DRAFT_858719 [Mycena epipterygia]|nr:hypothetical protein C8R44DRAFT_858719 [Mycena epipterygia]
MTSPGRAASTRGSSPASATSRVSSARADWLEILLLSAKTITAAAEFVPFPYVKGKVKKNREDWKELCETTMNIITIVHNQILVHGDSGASRFKELCEELENFLQEVYDAAQLFQKKPKGFRGRINKLSS